MRIVAGLYKGKRLVEFDLPNTRPTSDMLRESLFNILFDVQNKNFLDLFGGTGAVGFEALSRGANPVFIVENNINSYKVIIKNAQSLNAQNVNIIRSDYLDALDSFSRKKIKFDFVFLDPPYKSDFAIIALKTLLDKNLLHEQSVVVWEHDGKPLTESENGYTILKSKKYGDKILEIMQTIV